MIPDKKEGVGIKIFVCEFAQIPCREQNCKKYWQQKTSDSVIRMRLVSTKYYSFVPCFFKPSKLTWVKALQLLGSGRSHSMVAGEMKHPRSFCSYQYNTCDQSPQNDIYMLVATPTWIIMFHSRFWSESTIATSYFRLKSFPWRLRFEASKELLQLLIWLMLPGIFLPLFISQVYLWSESSVTF